MRDETGRPGPIDLSREPDFDLGRLEVRPSTREMIRGDQREVLEPKVLQVLVALHQAAGRVVSRDDLIARCWDGRIVGEDSINRVIGRLRRLSEADGGANFTIETIPKVGYRLPPPGVKEAPGAASETIPEPVVSDAPLARIEPAAPLPAYDKAPVPAPNKVFVGYRLAAGGAVLLVAIAFVAWLFWPASHWTVESSRPFISTLALEGEPDFSPDGKMLAYTSGTDTLSRKIYVRNIAGGDGIKVTGDAYDDSSPSWSPDGARLAYIARKPGEPCRIMVTSVPAGETREVGRCAQAESTSISWQPGTSFLYYFDHAAPSNEPLTDEIFRLDLDSGEQIKLTKKSANPILSMLHLQCSPDGKSLLFVGRENASTHALVIRDLASGIERVLGKIIISGSAAWSEDSRSVLTATASGIGSEITAYPINGDAPYHVYAAAINVSHLAAGVGGLLALETDPGRQNLARASTMPATQPDIIDPANGKSWAPTFAPDGTLAFLSNRSGTNAVWIMKPGGAPAMLYDGGLLPLFRLEFSPDGKYLALPIATEDGVNIHILTADGATVASFHSSALGGGAPTWTPDSKEVIAFDKTIFTYMRIDIADPARRRPAAPPLWGAITFRGGGTYAGRFDRPGYWEIDKGPRLVTAKIPIRWDETPAYLGNELLVPDFNAAGGPRILAQPLAGGPDRVLAYAPGAEAQEIVLQSKMAVNPKTGEVIYVAAVQSDTNIDLLTLAKR